MTPLLCRLFGHRPNRTLRRLVRVEFLTPDAPLILGPGEFSEVQSNERIVLVWEHPCRRCNRRPVEPARGSSRH